MQSKEHRLEAVLLEHKMLYTLEDDSQLNICQEASELLRPVGWVPFHAMI
jgi:hypothetical protein